MANDGHCCNGEVHTEVKDDRPPDDRIDSNMMAKAKGKSDGVTSGVGVGGRAGNKVRSGWCRGWVGCGWWDFHGVGFMDPHIAEEFEFGGGISRDVAGTGVPSMGSVAATQTTLKP